jgi:hypothetical protein
MQKRSKVRNLIAAILSTGFVLCSAAEVAVNPETTKPESSAEVAEGNVLFIVKWCGFVKHCLHSSYLNNLVGFGNATSKTA